MKMQPKGEVVLRQLPARIIHRDTTKQRQALVERGVLENDEDAFVFSAEISNNNLDAYFTRMNESTLKNFANDAKEGVSLQDSHDTRILGYGQSFDSVLEIDGDKSRVIADFYTIRGINFGGLHSYASTDDFIRAIEKKIVRDVSVGFYGGKETCDICGDPIWDWFSDCPHLPGVEYPIGDQGNETVICTASIIDARLSEVSVVYDGATPEAELIRKAERMIENGDLDSSTINMLESKYRIKLPVERLGEKSKKGARHPKGESQVPEDKQPTNVDPLSEIREQLRKVDDYTIEGIPADPLRAVAWLMGQHQELTRQIGEQNAENETLTQEVAKLKPKAADGDQYRSDLIANALEWGVRALGNDFDKEANQTLMESLPIAQVRQMGVLWQQMGNTRFEGGRVTTDDKEPEDFQWKDPLTPDNAFA
ncbi:hypothetical protein IH992_03805 [Candidatus Poribacteria bacterium]|nr:hypothetical protein [Candidatus Poribacteria bacterium]